MSFQVTRLRDANPTSMRAAVRVGALAALYRSSPGPVPAQRVHTSDLFTIADGRVFLPQTVGEAVEAVNREHLEVTAAFGMHYDRLPWQTVVGSAKPSAYPKP